LNNNQFLSTCPLFSDLDMAERAQILIIGQRQSCSGEQVIFREGDPGTGLYIVISGAVRISRHAITGEEALAVLGPDAFFGEMALIDLLPRAASAIANGPTDVFFIPLSALRAVLEANHHIALMFLYALCGVLTQRLRDTNDRFMSVFTIAHWGAGRQNDLIPLP
jgi:CRP/FNR family transcriptional regulator, cyclic AMP receptor protein